MPHKICYLDAFSGVSGDMLVGALADAGADRQSRISALDSLGTHAAIRFEPTKRCGIAATKFKWILSKPVHTGICRTS